MVNPMDGSKASMPPPSGPPPGEDLTPGRDSPPPIKPLSRFRTDYAVLDNCSTLSPNCCVDPTHLSNPLPKFSGPRRSSTSSVASAASQGVHSPPSSHFATIQELEEDPDNIPLIPSDDANILYTINPAKPPMSNTLQDRLEIFDYYHTLILIDNSHGMLSDPKKWQETQTFVAMLASVIGTYSRGNTLSIKFFHTLHVQETDEEYILMGRASYEEIEEMFQRVLTVHAKEWESAKEKADGSYEELVSLGRMERAVGNVLEGYVMDSEPADRTALVVISDEVPDKNVGYQIIGVANLTNDEDDGVAEQIEMSGDDDGLVMWFVQIGGDEEVMKGLEGFKEQLSEVGGKVQVGVSPAPGKGLAVDEDEVVDGLVGAIDRITGLKGPVCEAGPACCKC